MKHNTIQRVDRAAPNSGKLNFSCAHVLGLAVTLALAFAFPSAAREHPETNLNQLSFMQTNLPELKLSLVALNQVAAEVAVQAPSADRVRSIACYEVGVDGGKPDSPVAVAGLDRTLRIGTPFLWTPEARPLYAVIITGEEQGVARNWEIQFGFNAAGHLEITRGPRETTVRPAAKYPSLPTLFVVGDSTAYSNGHNQRGWGDEIGKCFDPSKLNVCNRARPGRSTRSYRSEGLWDRVLVELKPKDWVLIQFGHNDADKLAEGRCRGVLLGTGEETSEVKMPDGSVETVHTYGWYLRQFISEARARGATPVLLSLTVINVWRDGRILRPQSEYGQWAAALAAEIGVPFIDATEAIANRYDALGQARVQSLFCSEKDNVHTSPAGAALNAALITDKIEQLGFISGTH